MPKRTPKIRCPRGAIGQIILAERRRLGLSGSELARRASMFASRLFAYETAELAPGPRTLPRILEGLQLPQKLAPFLTALARIDIRLMRQVHALDVARNELVEGARLLVRQGAELEKKTQELRQQELREKDAAP